MNQKELEDLICELYEIDEVTGLIKNQISKFNKQHGYSFKDIGRAFYYYVVVLEKEARLEAGIGIVPYYMEQALKWFEQEKKRIEKLEKQGYAAKIASAEKKEVIKISKIERKKTEIVKVKIYNI